MGRMEGFEIFEYAFAVRGVGGCAAEGYVAVSDIAVGPGICFQRKRKRSGVL